MVCRFLPDTSPIRFYDRGQPYFEFTNFAEYPIQLDGKTWPTSEHYFQAQKFVGTPYEEQVRNLPRARDAFDLSRRPEVSQWLRSDWEKVKLDVMYKALLAKFSQHNNLRDMLMKTGNRQLIEHTSRDSYWGDGGDGHGQNNLGQLLMKVRSELSSSKSDNVVGQGISGATNIFSAFVRVKHVPTCSSTWKDKENRSSLLATRGACVHNRCCIAIVFVCFVILVCVFVFTLLRLFAD